MFNDSRERTHASLYLSISNKENDKSTQNKSVCTLIKRKNQLGEETSLRL